MEKSYMIRPVIYKCITRTAFAVTALLLWNKYINTTGHLSLLKDGCLTAGILFFCLAWFSYLRFDGMKVHHLLEEKKKKKTKIKGFADIVDFADEHITSYDELSDKEKAICALISNVICGVLFLIPAVIGMLI